MMTRRQAIRTGAVAGVALAASPGAMTQGHSAERAVVTADGPFTVPPLPYAYDALEPYIDARTMQIHHDKHHAAYVANLNKALAEAPSLAGKPIESILRDLDAVPEAIRTAVRNNGGGHANHTLFWEHLKKNEGRGPAGELAKAMEQAFGSFAGFQRHFSETATRQFGSGWAWLTTGANQRLAVESTPNQDTPLSQGRTPLLGIDVWEHAYYLKYQNRRPEYIAAFYHVINWDVVAGRLRKAAG